MPEWVEGKKVNLLVQMALRKDERFRDVPLITDLASNEEQRQIIRLIIAGQAIARPFFGPPGIPEDRKQALRAAFDRRCRTPSSGPKRSARRWTSIRCRARKWKAFSPGALCAAEGLGPEGRPGDPPQR